MKKFILGYRYSEDEVLTRFISVNEADSEAEEWCIVEAENYAEACDKYEETFERLKADGKINGCM